MRRIVIKNNLDEEGTIDIDNTLENDLRRMVAPHGKVNVVDKNIEIRVHDDKVNDMLTFLRLNK